MKKMILIFIGLSLAALAGCSKTQTLQSYLSGIEEIDYTSVTPDSGFLQAYQIFCDQPLDHAQPNDNPFKQKIVLQHRGYDRPVVLITEGYAMRSNFTRELAKLLQANEIRVEHRYFGESRPDSLIWDFLTVEQAARDHHRIVQIFQKIYGGHWVNTGWSKGGQTAIFHRYFYPQDVDATVAYDAPLNFSDHEPRIDAFFGKVGTDECRRQLHNFQKAALQNKRDLIALLEKYAEEKNLDFSIGPEAALEYAVLEYPFSFWQYHKLDCDSIPREESSSRVLFDHLKRIVSLSSYSDRALNSPAMYQFFTQLGYYGYVTTGLEKWLSGAYGYSNGIFAPGAAKGKYSPDLMKKINAWLQDNGNHMLYLYGKNDPWSAPGVTVSGLTNAARFDLEGGNHFTFIRSFPEKQRQEILDRLKNWLK